MLSQVSRISAIAVVAALLIAIAWLIWQMVIEERPGEAGALRTLGGLGGHFGAHQVQLEGEALLEHDCPALDDGDRGIREGDVRDLGCPVRVRTSGLLRRRR